MSKTQEEQLDNLRRDLNKKIAKAKPLVEQVERGELKSMSDEQKRLVESYPRWVSDLESVKKGEMPESAPSQHSSPSSSKKNSGGGGKKESAAVEAAAVAAAEEIINNNARHAAEEDSGAAAAASVDAPPVATEAENDDDDEDDDDDDETLAWADLTRAQLVCRLYKSPKPLRKAQIEAYVARTVPSIELVSLSRKYEAVSAQRRDANKKNKAAASVAGGDISLSPEKKVSSVALALDADFEAAKRELYAEQNRIRIESDKVRSALVADVASIERAMADAAEKTQKEHREREQARKSAEKKARQEQAARVRAEEEEQRAERLRRLEVEAKAREKDSAVPQQHADGSGGGAAPYENPFEINEAAEEEAARKQKAAEEEEAAAAATAAASAQKKKEEEEEAAAVKQQKKADDEAAAEAAAAVAAAKKKADAEAAAEERKRKDAAAAADKKKKEDEATAKKKKADEEAAAAAAAAKKKEEEKKVESKPVAPVPAPAPAAAAAAAVDDDEDGDIFGGGGDMFDVDAQAAAEEEEKQRKKEEARLAREEAAAAAAAQGEEEEDVDADAAEADAEEEEGQLPAEKKEIDWSVIVIEHNRSRRPLSPGPSSRSASANKNIGDRSSSSATSPTAPPAAVRSASARAGSGSSRNTFWVFSSDNVAAPSGKKQQQQQPKKETTPVASPGGGLSREVCSARVKDEFDSVMASLPSNVAVMQINNNSSSSSKKSTPSSISGGWSPLSSVADIISLASTLFDAGTMPAVGGGGGGRGGGGTRAASVGRSAVTIMSVIDALRSFECDESGHRPGAPSPAVPAVFNGPLSIEAPSSLAMPAPSSSSGRSGRKTNDKRDDDKQQQKQRAASPPTMTTTTGKTLMWDHRYGVGKHTVKVTSKSKNNNNNNKTTTVSLGLNFIVGGKVQDRFDVEILSAASAEEEKNRQQQNKKKHDVAEKSAAGTASVADRAQLFEKNHDDDDDDDTKKSKSSPAASSHKNKSSSSLDGNVTLEIEIERSGACTATFIDDATGKTVATKKFSSASSGSSSSSSVTMAMPCLVAPYLRIPASASSSTVFKELISVSFSVPSGAKSGGDKKKQPQQQQQQGVLRCAVTGATLGSMGGDVVLGVGAEVIRSKQQDNSSNNSSNGPTVPGIVAIRSSAQLVSSALFPRMSGVRDARGTRLDVFVPLLLDAKLKGKTMPLLRAAVMHLTRKTVTPYAPPFVPTVATRACAMMLDGCVSDLTNSNIAGTSDGAVAADEEEIVSRYIALFHNFAALVAEHPEMAAEATKIITQQWSNSNNNAFSPGLPFAFACVTSTVTWPSVTRKALASLSKLAMALASASKSNSRDSRRKNGGGDAKTAAAAAAVKVPTSEADAFRLLSSQDKLFSHVLFAAALAAPFKGPLTEISSSLEQNAAIAPIKKTMLSGVHAARSQVKSWDSMSEHLGVMLSVRDVFGDASSK